MAHRLLTRIRLVWRKRFGLMPLRDALEPLSAWFSAPLGQRLLAQEQAFIDEELPNLFGYHLMQLSVAKQLNLTQASRIAHRFALYPQLPDATPALVTALADFNHLPLPANSIDLVLLHHVLDYSQRPHHVLREAAGTLISHGHILIVGFNPWSLYGVWCWLARFFSRAPQWRHQSLRLGRVLDWLAVLDFDPLVVKQGFYCPTCRSKSSQYLHWVERWGKRLGLPFGGFYLIVARKDTLAMTPLKPQWQGYAGLRGWGVTKILGRAIRGQRPQTQHNIHSKNSG